MKLSQFSFFKPSEDLIAQYPVKNRDESKLMVVNRKNNKIQHCQFKDIIEFFSDRDVMVFNNTKVFPARLFGNKEKTGAKIEVFLLRELNREQKLWDVLVDPARKIRIGNKLYFGEGDELVAEVIDNTTSRGRTLRFLYYGDYEEFKTKLYSLGETPLPKQIKRKVEPEDRDRFQTVFAKHEGAVAAPAAGMHFSRELLKRLEIKGVEFAEVTAHIGVGNFRSIDVEDLTKHKMDSEQIIITDDASEIVNRGKANKKNICAVGASSARAMESSMSTNGLLKPYDGWTNKFLFPPYEFQVSNMLITNFHLPQTPFLMLVSAFSGYELSVKAYNAAIKEKYRFGPYGDAMIVI